jgi:hypothetical protein
MPTDKPFITVDNDSRSELRMLMTVINASKLGRVDIRSTAHGYHYRIFKEGLGRPPRKARRDLRRLLGDDSSRLYFEEIEELHGLTQWEDTLFEAKRGRDGKWHFEEPVDNPLALPFWSAATARKLEPKPRKEWNRTRWRKYGRRKAKA